jgi:hypothetical protein
VIDVGDLNEEVRATARLAFLVGTWRWLHKYAGRIGRDAERSRKGFLAHRLDDRRADNGTGSSSQRHIILR